MVSLPLLGSPPNASTTEEQSAQRAANEKSFHVRLIWKENPSREATVSWSTSFQGTDHLVEIRPRGSHDEYRTVKSYRNARFGRSSKTDPVYYHHTIVGNLMPDHEYEIVVRGKDDSGQAHATRKYFFRTAPEAPISMSILFGGDSRGNRQKCRQMNRFIAHLSRQDLDQSGGSVEQIARKTSDAEPSVRLLAFAHVGDYVKTGTNFEHWNEWLSDHELTTTDSGRILPIIPARGNHDRGLIYNEVFDFQPTDDNYFLTRLSPVAAMITLNTEATMAGHQAKWLRRTLSETRPSYRWLLAQYHRPAYPAVGFPSGARNQWVPLFDEFGLDMACEGDGHTIKRTLPIRSNRHDESGVVYIGEGGLAVGQRTPKHERWYLQEPGFAGKGHHIQRLTLSPTRLKYECLLVNGQVVDSWQRTYRPTRDSKPTSAFP